MPIFVNTRDDARGPRAERAVIIDFVEAAFGPRDGSSARSTPEPEILDFVHVDGVWILAGPTDRQSRAAA